MRHSLKYLLILVLSVVTIVTQGLKKDSERSGDYHKAILFFNRQQFDSAEFYFKSVLQNIDQIYTEDDDPSLKGKLFLHIGSCELLREEFTSAVSWFTLALTEVKGEGPLAVVAYQNIGNNYYFQRDYETAVQNYQKAMLKNLSTSRTDPVRLFEILANLGAAYIGNHENQKGLSCLLNAESLYGIMKSADPTGISGVYLNLGKLYLSSGDPRTALNYYTRGMNRNDENRNDHKEIRVTADKGVAASYLALGDLDSATIYLDKALNEIRSELVSLSKELPEIYLQKGDIFFRKDDLDSAFYYYNYALQLVSKGKDLNDSSGNKIVSGHQNSRMVTDILERNAKTHLVLGIRKGNDTNLLKKAFGFYKESMRINNTIQGGFLKDKSRLVFNDNVKTIYSGALETSYSLWRSGLQGYKDEMWMISELMRGPVLESKLRELKAATFVFADTLEFKRMAVRSKIGELSRKKISEFSLNDEKSLKALQKELEDFTDLLIEDDSLTLKWRKIVSGCSETEDDNRKTLQSEVRSQLYDHDCLLEYYCADSALYIFVLSTDTFHVERVIHGKLFSSQPNDLTRTLQHFDRSDFPEICHRLYKSLIEPVRPLIEGKRHLIIIPDEEISSVPFEVLICGKNSEMKKQKGSAHDYLIDEFSISYQFSSSSFIISRRQLYEDPIRFLGIAPGFLNPQSSEISFDPLRSSLAEVKTIGTMFSKGNHYSCSMTNESSIKKSIFHSAGNFSHLHFATHSIKDELYPDSPGLVVETGELNGRIPSGQEMVLWSEEIENTRLKADLVVLSACGTGKGRITKTEGILGLPRSFFIAGSSNVLYTLWNIPDHHARSFMEIFYRKFLSGKNYSDALREAKIEMLRSEVTSHPYLWAGFVLLGN